MDCYLQLREVFRHEGEVLDLSHLKWSALARFGSISKKSADRFGNLASANDPLHGDVNDFEVAPVAVTGKTPPQPHSPTENDCRRRGHDQASAIKPPPDRWISAGLFVPERQFLRVMGYGKIPLLFILNGNFRLEEIGRIGCKGCEGRVVCVRGGNRTTSLVVVTSGARGTAPEQ